jgi:hypothetical protein
VCAYDSATGALRWRQPVSGTATSVGRLATSYGNLIVADDGYPAVVRALGQTTGYPIWTYDDVSSSGTRLNIYTAPVTHDGLVIFSDDEGVTRALDASTGHVVWRFIAHNEYGVPVFHGDTMYLHLSNGGLQARKTSTGAISWTGQTGGTTDVSSVVVGNAVYVVDSQSPPLLEAFTAGGCGQEYCAPSKTWALTGYGSNTVVVGSVYGDVLVRGLVLGQNVVSRFSPVAGRVLWSTRPVDGGVSAPISVGGDVLYVFFYDGLMLAYPIDGCGSSSCASTWERQVNTASMGPGLNRPVVFDGSLYVVGSSQLRAGVTIGTGDITSYTLPSPATARFHIAGSPTVPRYSGGPSNNLIWAVPTSTGGLPIVLWDVMLSDGQEYLTSRYADADDGGPGLSTSAFSKPATSTVTFKVRAVTAYGPGPWSVSSAPIRWP